MRLPAAGRPVDATPPVRRARVRLALHYAGALSVVAALMVLAVYLVLSRAVDVETTQRRTVTDSTPDGLQENVEEEVTTEVEQEVESRVADRTLDRLRTTSLVLLAGLFVASLALGWFIAGRVLAPVEAAMAAQRRFVRDASHELRNPLAVMRTSLDLALEDRGTSSAAWREAGLGMRDTVDRMGGVVDSLLRAARDELPAAHTTTFDPADVLRSLAAQVELAAGERDVTIHVEAEPARIPGDPAAIERAVANLVDNALRHAPASSTVTLSGHASQAGSGRNYEIRVRDAGPGLDAPQIDTVFERGYRSPDSPGLGLGLAIARDIVEAHHGHISVDRTGPDGTTFLISLPT